MPNTIKLEIEKEITDQDTQTLHIRARIVERNEKGEIVEKGEVFQRGFCLPGENEDYNFEEHIGRLESGYKERFFKAKRVKDKIEKALKTRKNK